MSGSLNVIANLPLPNIPMVNPVTGVISEQWFFFFQRLLARTGGTVGVNSTAVETLAEAAQTTATAAQLTANNAQTSATAAQTTANNANTAATAAAANAAAAQTSANTANAAVAAETTRAENAEALLAPLASPTFSGTITLAGVTWTTGNAVPTSTQTRGSIYSRTGGGVGTTLYVSQGGGTWNAVAGV